MDFFPGLGEPGIFDDLFWFGPIILQVILLSLFFWVIGKRTVDKTKRERVVMAFSMTLVADLFLFVVCIVVFKIANPDL